MDQVKIGAFIARLRREKDWTQEELGERLGVTNKTVSRWETGTYMPGVEMLTLLGRELDVTLNELLEGRRLEGDDFRAAADERLATAMLSPGQRVRQWLARYGGFAAATLILCVVLGTVIWAYWQYRSAHPQDVDTERATFMYQTGDLKDILYFTLYREEYYIFTASGEYLEHGSFVQNGDALRLNGGETARWVTIKGKQVRDVDPRDGKLITSENLFDDHAFFIGKPDDIP